MRIVYALIFLFLLQNCKTEVFYREKELASYLKNETKYNLSNEKFTVILLQVDICGACSKEALENLNDIITDKNQKTIIILSEKRNDIVSLLSEKNIEFHIDENYKLEEYGLKLYTDYIFYFENGNVKEYHVLEDLIN